MLKKAVDVESGIQSTLLSLIKPHKVVSFCI